MTFEEYEKEDDKWSGFDFTNTTLGKSVISALAMCCFMVCVIMAFADPTMTPLGVKALFIGIISVTTLVTFFTNWNANTKKLAFQCFKYVQWKIMFTFFAIAGLIQFRYNPWMMLVMSIVGLEVVYIFFSYKKPKATDELTVHVIGEKLKALYHAVIFIFGSWFLLLTGADTIRKFTPWNVMLSILVAAGIVLGIAVGGYLIYKIACGYIWLNALKYKAYMPELAKKEVEEAKKMRTARLKREALEKKKEEAKKKKLAANKKKALKKTTKKKK